MNSNFKIGSADWNFWPISTKYDVIFPQFKESGIDYLELGIYKPSSELNTENRKRIIELAGKNNIEISAALFSLTPEKWPNGAFSNKSSNFLSECEVFLESLEIMNIKFANIWTGADLRTSNLQETVNTLELLDNLSGKFSGTVSIEYKADTIFPNGRALAEFLKELVNLKVLVDTGHAFALEEDILELIKFLSGKNLLGAIHLGDATPGDSDSDLPCGRVHDFTEIMRLLNEIDYSGTANFDLYGAAIDESGPGPLSILSESHNHIKTISEKM